VSQRMLVRVAMTALASKVTEYDGMLISVHVCMFRWYFTLRSFFNGIFRFPRSLDATQPIFPLFNKSALVQNQFKLNGRKFRNRAQSRKLTNWYCRIYNSDVMIVIMVNLCLMEIFLVQMTARR
jgi:hypothetical protein